MPTTTPGARLQPESDVALRRFAAALREPQRVQHQVLRSILLRNAASEWGRRFDLGRIEDARAYRDQVPIGTYDGIRDEIERMARGEANVLTSDPVIAWEETGGSRHGPKLIPYTALGLAHFRAGLQPWLAALEAIVPAAFAGRSYWSISPAARAPRCTPAGDPIGMPSDAAYFGEPHASRLLGQLAVPFEACSLLDIERWRRYTLVHLVACTELSLVSVWSPTFFTELLAALRREADVIADVISGVKNARAMFADLPLPEPDPSRADCLLDVMSAASVDLHALWPDLALISCWTHARAEPWAGELAGAFPRARLQGKGLLATEALVSLPVDVEGDPVLAIGSGFFEFRDARGAVRMAHEVGTGEDYEVVLTTASGLYRYSIGDRVRVTGWVEATPRLRFLGRTGIESDLCGEKLADAFVAGVVAATGLKFALLVAEPQRPGYVLVVDAQEVPPTMGDSIAGRIEDGLCANPQYAYARRLGQLRSVSVRRAREPMAAWLQRGLRRGQCLGNIKLPSLHAGEDVATLFVGPA